MNREQLLAALTGRFSTDIIRVVDKSPRRLYIDIEAAALVAVATYLFKHLRARFNTASGVDGRDRMEILYHFTLDDIDLVLSLRVTLAKTDLRIDSLTPLSSAFYWIEREIHELLGIDFVGHPNLQRLLLPEDWPRDVHPLRKDFQEWDPNAIRDRGA
jgi:NADH-quinone oxidoreductase subunit C